MLEGKAVVNETDMLETMQQEALQLAAKALDLFDVTEPTEIAQFIKKVNQLVFFLIESSNIRPQGVFEFDAFVFGCRISMNHMEQGGNAQWEQILVRL